MKYHVNWRYASVYKNQPLGPWNAGQEVELDDETAEFVQRDSPGVLSPVEAGRALKTPPKDRQQRGGLFRAGKGKEGDDDGE